MAKKTHEQYVLEINELFNNEYEVLTEYTGNKNKIQVKHLECGDIREVYPSNFLRSKGTCKICEINSRPQKGKEFMLAIKSKFGGNKFRMVDDFVNITTKTRFKHLECGREFDIYPHQLLTYGRCNVCSNEQRIAKITKTREQYREELLEKQGNDYELLSDYINMSEKVVILHKTCGSETEITAYNALINKIACKNCSLDRKSSGEKLIREWLDKNNYKYERQIGFPECVYKEELKFDFGVYINDDIYLIEFDGMQHKKGWGKTSNDKFYNEMRDGIKELFCSLKNIPILRVTKEDKDNLDSILKEFLSNKKE